MPDNKPTIREQWEEYRKTACEWCAVHLNHEGKGDAKATDVLPQSAPNFVHKVYPPLCAGKLSQYLRCTALPFEAWAAWRIEQLEQVREAAADLATAMETCHTCLSTVLVDDSPTHCEDCSYDCEEHQEPSCPGTYELHRKLGATLKALAAQPDSGVKTAGGSGATS